MVSSVSIVLPVYNQADHVGGLVGEYLAALAKLPVPFELILVVNASRDRSLEICEELARQDARITALHSHEGGWGRAVRTGLARARGDLLCYTNLARTRPQDLLLFLLYSYANPEVVIKANRRFRDNWMRRLGSLLYNLQVRALFDLAFWDINGTPKVFPRKFGRLLELRENGDLIDAEFNILCRRENYPVLEVPVISVTRRGGKSTTNFRSAAVMYWEVFRLRREFSERKR